MSCGRDGADNRNTDFSEGWEPGDSNSLQEIWPLTLLALQCSLADPELWVRTRNSVWVNLPYIEKLTLSCKVFQNDDISPGDSRAIVL